MNYAQGGYRSKPDGYLHLQNFAVTKSSGLAGALFNYVMTSRQKDIVEASLLEIAEKDPDRNFAHFKHEVWRFHKAFLREHFKSVVYGAFKLFRRNASELMAIEINREYLATQVARLKFN
ncbi:hypothetical protein [Pseudomonas sp. B14(2017)]|uniref:hypothetical protein n=1 Tax=Pseudomonas sp. B14(2017) TaxID=1981745 RepID=UPI000A1DA311|nr:hypothetical protein [Pseudomonas sp. B14(2017)]